MCKYPKKQRDHATDAWHDLTVRFVYHCTGMIVIDTAEAQFGRK